MNSPESFYLHLSGAQQGPYTIPQIDHLLNSGLIGIETLYWCEGLDQWQPVTSLVALRVKPKRWVKPVIFVGLLLLLAIPARIFGPVLVVGWQEANQHAFSESAAYWKARDVVRTKLREQKTLVEFLGEDEARTTLGPDANASVRLRGFTVEGDRLIPSAWAVRLSFDRQDQEWSGAVVSVEVQQ